MSIFSNFFRKRKRIAAVGRGEGGTAFTSARSEDDAAETSTLPGALPADDALPVIERELSGLAQMAVPQATRERGWALLQRELERNPVGGRAAATGSKAGTIGAQRSGRGFGVLRARPHGLRWVVASAAGLLVVAAAVLGTYGGGLLQTADTDGQSTTTTWLASSGISEQISEQPSATVTTTPAVSTGSDTSDPVTTITTTGPAETEGYQPGSPGSSVTVPVDGDQLATSSAANTPAVANTPVVNTSATTTATVRTTSRTTGRPSATATTQTTVTAAPSGSSGRPSQTTQMTTTGEPPQYAAAQREGSARTAVAFLGNMVVSGDTSGARGVIAPAAQSSLAWMEMSLSDPYGYKITGATSLSDGIVRVTLDIKDRIVDGRGELVEVVKYFSVRVRVDAGGATIIAINAGS
ncbi:MAG: hypothetical protein ACOX8V_07420 [Thermoleophilia bacterium]|jgi:hypothetical protein